MALPEGFYYKPRVDKELLRKYSEGIIAIECLPGRGGTAETHSEMYPMRRRRRSRWNILTFSGRAITFLELQDHGIREQKIVNAALVRMSKETGIPTDLPPTIAIISIKRTQSRMIFCFASRRGKRFWMQDRMRYEGGQFYVKSPMRKCMIYFPLCLRRARIRAEDCRAVQREALRSMN